MFIEKKVEGRVPDLEEVRNAVERDLVAQRRRDANEKIYQRLRERYTVTIERLESADSKTDEGAAQ